MRARIARYRHAAPGDRSDFTIGCRVLAPTFFFDEVDWLEVPQSWSRNIVSFKTYTTDDPDGMRLWQATHRYLESMPDEGQRYLQAGEPAAPPFIGQKPLSSGWGEPTLIRPRLDAGQSNLPKKAGRQHTIIATTSLTGLFRGQVRSAPPQPFIRPPCKMNQTCRLRRRGFTVTFGWCVAFVRSPVPEALSTTLGSAWLVMG